MMATMKRQERVARWWLAGLCGLLVTTADAQTSYRIEQISLPNWLSRVPVMSENGWIVWDAYLDEPNAPSRSQIHIHEDGQTRSLISETLDRFAHREPYAHGDAVTWSATLVGSDYQADAPGREFQLQLPPIEDGTLWERQASFRRKQMHSGAYEVLVWRGSGAPQRLTVDDNDDAGAVVDGDLVAWRKARRWPYGWEIILWDGATMMQLTTNVHYDMGVKIDGQDVVWYGWDGTDYEIYHYNHADKTMAQITDNEHDDMSPIVENGVIVWESYPNFSADIMMYRDGETLTLSDNVDDDTLPRMWNGQVVWQGFDGEFFQVYHYDGTNTVQLTRTEYDSIQPDIHDGLIVWCGHVENFDGEIFAMPIGGEPQQVTDNDIEDNHPRTAGGRIAWHASSFSESTVWLAEPE
jgi:hypothetical protein